MAFGKLSFDIKIKVLSGYLEEVIKEVCLHPVKWEIVLGDLPTDTVVFDGVARELDGTEFEDDMDEICGEIRDCWEWDTTILPEVKYLEVFSKGYRDYGETDIDRGKCYHPSIKFEEKDFRWGVSTSFGCCLDHLVEAVYRVKNSKYNYWNELYTEIKIHSWDSGHLVLEVVFDRGS